MEPAHYRLTGPDAAVAGEADVQVTGEALTIVPPDADVLHIPYAQIESSRAADGFTLQVRLTGGVVIELSRLGRMRTQVLADLRRGQAAEAARATAALGPAEAFTAARSAEQADVRIYDESLLITGPHPRERIAFSFLTGATAEGPAVTVTAAGRDPVVLTGLGSRTTEFTRLLAQRRAAARVRTAAFLSTLCPSLDPITLGRAAGLLQDGRAVALTALDAVRPGLATDLLDRTTVPERRAAVAELRRRTTLAFGFRQIESVHRRATGTQPWRDSAVTPHFDQHDGRAGSFPAGPLGPFTASLVSAAGGRDGFGWGGFGPGAFGGEGYLFAGGYAGFGPPAGLATAIGADRQPWMTRSSAEPVGRLTPAHDDLTGLTTDGAQPTVLAFVLGTTGLADETGSAGETASPHETGSPHGAGVSGDTGVLEETFGRVVFDVVSRPGPVTWVFRAGGPDALTTINRALDDAGFDPTAVPLAGQAAHGDQWSDQLAALLTG